MRSVQAESLSVFERLYHVAQAVSGGLKAFFGGEK